LATLSQIKSPVWTYSILGGGAIAEGLAAIRQCIDIILRTTKGSDPLRPLFGSDCYKYQDQPVNVSIPNIKKAIIDAIGLWETRVTITDITHTINVSQVIFNIGYQLVDGTLTDSIDLTIGGNGMSTNVSPRKLTLQGYFPPNPSGFQYQISCILNGENILPVPPANGFGSIDEMFTWIQTNWVNYGQWYITANSIIGYINSGYTTGTFTISILTKNRFQGGIPGLPIGYKYDVQITVDGTLFENSIDLFTPDQIVNWAQNNLGYLGLWQIVTNPGSFNDDFSEDFQLYLQILVLYTSQAQSVIINITTITQ